MHLLEPTSKNRVQTKSGGIVSILALLFMSILFVTEVSLYLTTEISPQLSVDQSLGGKIDIHLDITFPSLPCVLISVNAIDKSGEHQLDLHHDLFTLRLNRDGQPVEEGREKEHVGEDRALPNVTIRGGPPPCGNCWGAESPDVACCNTCDDVKKAYLAKGWSFDSRKVEQCIEAGLIDAVEKQKGEGCNVHGLIRVARVAGNINIVPGKFILQNSRFFHDSQLLGSNENVFDISHTINKIAFGEEYPGMKNPLNGLTRKWTNSKTSAMYEYLVKVVPTTYKASNGEVIKTNQYSATEYVIEVNPDDTYKMGIAGFFLIYDLSPILVSFKEENIDFLSFFTNLLAILGGVFTVASLFDTILYGSLKSLQKKVDLGKTR